MVSPQSLIVTWDIMRCRVPVSCRLSIQAARLVFHLHGTLVRIDTAIKPPGEDVAGFMRKNISWCERCCVTAVAKALRQFARVAVDHIKNFVSTQFSYWPGGPWGAGSDWAD